MTDETHEVPQPGDLMLVVWSESTELQADYQLHICLKVYHDRVATVVYQGKKQPRFITRVMALLEDGKAIVYQWWKGS